MRRSTGNSQQGTAGRIGLPFSLVPVVDRCSRIGPAMVLSCLAAVLAGCGSSSSPSPTPVPGYTYPVASFTGQVKAGSQPMIAAQVQLYAMGSSGNGSAGVPLLSSALTTDSTGSFTLATGTTCPAASSQLYLVARGGRPGPSATQSAAAVMLAALGACGDVVSGGTIAIDEATTVAAAYAFAPFLTAGGNIGSTATNVTGIANAAASARSLADPVTGLSPGASFPANGIAPAARINSLANALNACINSSSACTALFNATSTAGLTPSTTLDAVMNLAQHPATGTAAVYQLSTASQVYSPVLTAAPPDWTMYVNLLGGGMNGPHGLAVDSKGNVWVASFYQTASLFSTIGTSVFANGITGSGLSGSYGIAVDAGDNAWIANEPNGAFPGNSVTVLNTAGQPVSGPSGYTAGGLSYPISVAIDPNTNVWLVDYGNSHVSVLSGSTGASLAGASGYTSNGFAFPVFVALDTNHNAWIANQGSQTVTRLSADGQTSVNFTCCNEAAGIAIDAANNVWVANYLGDSVSLINAAGTVVSSGYTGGGIYHPQALAVDGAGNVWVANFRGKSMSELAGATSSTPGAVVSPALGWAPDAQLSQAFGIAVDASGSVWISNFGSNTVTKFIGIAVPVKTPLLGPVRLP